MKFIIKLFGVLLVLAGLILLIKPEFIIGWLDGNVDHPSLYISAIVARLVLGLLFIATAKVSKYPLAIKILGYLFILAAVIFVFMGQETFSDLMSSLITGFKPYAPVSGLLSMGFGGFIIYAFSKLRRSI